MKLLEVSGCLMEYKGKILILHRNPNILEGDKWGLPAGRLEKGENKLTAVIREIEEETSYRVKRNEIKFEGVFTGDYNNVKIKFYYFRIKLKKKPKIKLNPKEHTEFKWVTPREFYKMKNLTWAVHEVLERVYGI